MRLGRERGDSQLEWRGRLQALWTGSATDPTVTVNEMQSTAEAAIPVFEQIGDESGLAHAWYLLSHACNMRHEHEAQIQALEQALTHAGRAGDTAHEAMIMGWLAVAYFFGPTPVDQAQARLEQIRDEARAKSLLFLEGIILGFLGGVEGLRGNFAEARDIFYRGRAVLSEIGLRPWVAGQTQIIGQIEELAGDYRAAERELRLGYEELERMGETGIRSLISAMLADALYEQGRDEEAEPYVRACRGMAAAEDYVSQIAWRSVAARLLARRGELDESERVAREAVGISREGAEMLLPANPWTSLGEVLALVGKLEEAEDAFAHVLRLHEAKGNVAGVAQVRALAASLGLELQ